MRVSVSAMRTGAAPNLWPQSRIGAALRRSQSSISAPASLRTPRRRDRADVIPVIRAARAEVPSDAAPRRAVSHPGQAARGGSRPIPNNDPMKAVIRQFLGLEDAGIDRWIRAHGERWIDRLALPLLVGGAVCIGIALGPGKWHGLAPGDWVGLGSLSVTAGGLFLKLPGRGA